jgi:hypothetical protein
MMNSESQGTGFTIVRFTIVGFTCDFSDHFESVAYHWFVVFLHFFLHFFRWTLVTLQTPIVAHPDAHGAGNIEIEINSFVTKNPAKMLLTCNLGARHMH